MFTLTIATDNAAFEDSDELPRILRIVTHRLEEGERYGALYDINGNHVGEFRVKVAES